MGKKLEVRISFSLCFLFTLALLHVLKVEIYYKLNFSTKNEQCSELPKLWKAEEDSTDTLADPLFRMVFPAANRREGILSCFHRMNEHTHTHTHIVLTTKFVSQKGEFLQICFCKEAMRGTTHTAHSLENLLENVVLFPHPSSPSLRLKTWH